MINTFTDPQLDKSCSLRQGVLSQDIFSHPFEIPGAHSITAGDTVTGMIANREALDLTLPASRPSTTVDLPAEGHYGKRGLVAVLSWHGCELEMDHSPRTIHWKKQDRQ